MATHDQSTPISDVPWPKRTNKACCNCRRDKIKCDGGRPCAACLRKGLTEEKCIDGCPPCRRSRARCDGGDPCGRCLELGIDCSDDSASPSLSFDDSAHRKQTISTRSVQTGRAKLACQACRRDNKKCDDNRPCSRCISRMEECIHIERTPKAVKHRCVNCRMNNKKCEDNRPCNHCIEMHLDCIDAPRKGSGGTRVKMACANCRKNKVQCNPERPCRVCVRRGLECTMPSCTCAGTGDESANCAFCRSRRSKRVSQSRSDTGSFEVAEGRQSSNAESMSPVTSDVRVYNEFADLQAPQASSRSNTYGQYMSSQGRAYPTNAPSTDAFPGEQYTSAYSTHQNISFQQETGQQAIPEIRHSGNQLEYHFTTNSQDHRQGPPISLSHSTHHDVPTDIGNFMNSDTNNTVGLANRYLPRGMIDPSSETNFVSPTSYTHGGSAAPTDFSESTGVGIGTCKAGGMIGFEHLPQSYGPVPAAVPVSVMIPVVLNSHLRNNSNTSSEGQIDMHPQLRRSAYYLTSDSRTPGRGDDA